MQEQNEKKKYETPQISEVIISGPVLLNEASNGGGTEVEDDY